jgi:trigger factor
MENEAVDAVIKNATVQIPDAMLKTQERQMVDEFAQQLQYQGMTIDQYFEYSGNDRDKMMEVMAPQAEKRILTRLVLEQIVKEENITVSEEDFEEELQKLAASYGADLDTVKNIFVGKERERMEEDIAVQKAVSFVADHAVEVEKAEEAAETEEA